MSIGRCRRSGLISSISNLSDRMGKQVLLKGRGHTRGQTDPSILAKVRIEREASGLGCKLTIAAEDRHLNDLWVVYDRDGNRPNIFNRESLC